MNIYKLPIPFTNYEDMKAIAEDVHWMDLPDLIDTTRAYYVDDWYDGGVVLRCTMSGEPLYILTGEKK